MLRIAIAAGVGYFAGPKLLEQGFKLSGVVPNAGILEAYKTHSQAGTAVVAYVAMRITGLP